MSHTERAVVVGVVVTLFACGGGDSAPTVHTLRGTARAAEGNDVDVDTGDPFSPQGDNDDLLVAQAISSVVTLGGWASARTDRLDDADVYRTTLTAGQALTLAIADPADADLDLCLIPTDTMQANCSANAGAAVETLTVTADGEYYVAVLAFEVSPPDPAAFGASNYVLTIGQSGQAAGARDALKLSAEFVPGEVVVRFRDDLLTASAAETVEARAASLGLEPKGGGPRREMLMAIGSGEGGRARAFEALGIHATPHRLLAGVLDPIVREKLDTLRVIGALRARADVASADPNFVHRAAAVPTDTHYGFQWHYPLIKLPQAWDLEDGAPDAGQVIVAVVDTGVYLAHPDFGGFFSGGNPTGKLVPGYDFISDATSARDGNGVDPDPNDVGDSASPGSSSWHGTHVAGTVGALSNNASGVAGVSWGAKVMPIRVLGVGGGTSFDIMQGVRWAAGLLDAPAPPTRPAQRADVINLSLGCLDCFSTAEQNLYTEVRSAGVVVVAAAGNESSSTRGYPASYDGVISVSAVDMSRARAPYSNYGDRVDVAAPGGDASKDLDRNGYADGVLSTIVSESSTGAKEPAYAFLQGTSMASPHVAGVVALMKAACSSLLPGQVDGILTGGGMTVDLGTAGRDDIFGYGLVDALEAVQSAQAVCTPTPAALEVTPESADFGTTQTTLSVVLSKVGAGTLPAATFSEVAPWLTVTPPGGDGLGNYTLTADRTSLADGLHTATVEFAAGTSRAALLVSVQQGTPAAGAGDAGHIYILLVHAATFASDPDNAVVGQAGRDAVAGAYVYGFGGIPAGEYYVIAGSDSDDDGFICDDGESCGAYPTLGLLTAIDVTQNPVGVDFTVGFDVSFGAAALEARGSRGFPVLRPVKRAGALP